MKSTTSYSRYKCPNEENKSSCLVENQAAESGCLTNFLVVHDLP